MLLWHRHGVQQARLKLLRVAMKAKTASTQKWSVVALLLDCAALAVAFLIYERFSQAGPQLALNRSIAQHDLLVGADALLWIYAMGLYRAEGLVSRDVGIPLFVALCLSTLFAAALSFMVGRGDLISSRWLLTLPLAFSIILVFRSAFCRVATLSSGDVREEKERRQVSLDGLNLVRFDSTLNPTRTMLSHCLKRIFDTVSCIILFTFTLPVSIAAVAAILVMDGRPIFYRQERVGKDGRVFQLYKFRTMCVSAEADGVARWAQKNDSRVTSIGHVLRRTRIDEFPQFINVLLGDMSLVGPRPERVEIVRQLEQVIPNYGCRHLVKPGITGWAQVNYPYGASVADAFEKTKHDFYYINNGSLILDTIIILQTVRVILTAEGSR